MVAEFKDNTGVAFADVVLQHSGIRSIHGVNQAPGAGGWPTIRYYNQATGYGGEVCAAVSARMLICVWYAEIHQKDYTGHVLRAAGDEIHAWFCGRIRPKTISRRADASCRRSSSGRGVAGCITAGIVSKP